MLYKASSLFIDASQTALCNPNLCSPALFTPFGCIIFANILHSIQFGSTFVALFFYLLISSAHS
jgi:hypothetical protein